jgi:hypothetical protein
MDIYKKVLLVRLFFVFSEQIINTKHYCLLFPKQLLTINHPPSIINNFRIFAKNKLYNVK